MKFRLPALVLFLFSLTSCFDVYETFNLDGNGGGTYIQKMDFTRAMSIANMMKGNTPDGGKPQQKIDSSFSLQPFSDTAAGLTTEEKNVLAKAMMHLKVDDASGEMHYSITYPFASTREFDLIQQSFSKKGGKGAAMSALGTVLGTPNGASALPEEKTPELPSSSFTYQLTGNSLVKKVRPGAARDSAEAAPNDMPAEFKEMMKMSFTTTVNLPRPIKKFSGNNGTLSADKKQLKFSRQVDMDTKLTPEDFDFSIQY